MKKINLFLTGIIVMILVGCGGSAVDNAISQVDKAIDKIEKKKGSMTEEDWTAIQKEVEAPMTVIADAMKNDKVGAITKMKIITVTAKWATVLSEAGINEMGKKAGELGIDLQNAGKELEKATQSLDSVK